MSADEFEQKYAERSGYTVEQLREFGRVVRPCNCGSPICEGWQSVSRETAAEFDAGVSDTRFIWPVAEQPPDESV